MSDSTTLHPTRRQLLLASSMLAVASLPRFAHAEARRFDPRPGRWRTFEVTTRVEIKDAKDATRVWLPIPSIDSDYQKSLESTWSGNAAAARIVADAHYGARMLCGGFGASNWACRMRAP